MIKITIDDEFDDDNPRPTPNEGESREEFVARFMSDEQMIQEFPDESQRRKIAQETFDRSGS